LTRTLRPSRCRKLSGHFRSTLRVYPSQCPYQSWAKKAKGGGYPHLAHMSSSDWIPLAPLLQLPLCNLVQLESSEASLMMFRTICVPGLKLSEYKRLFSQMSNMPLGYEMAASNGSI